MRTFKKKFVPMQSTAVELTIGKNKIKVQFDKLKRVCSVKKILEDESLETIPTLWYRIIGRNFINIIELRSIIYDELYRLKML